MIFIDRNKYGKNFGIYCIKNLKNDFVYVGQTCENFGRRFLHHSWSLRNNRHCNKHLQNSFNKYGEENFIFEVLELVEDVNSLDDLERKYVDEARSNRKSFNIQDGGQDKTNLGRHLSEEHKRKIGDKNRINMTGKKASEATKKKMSETRKGKTCKGNCKISFDLAIKIKIMLMNNVKTRDICKTLEVEYRIVNNILSNNTYKDAFVEGWNEFYNKRKNNR